MAFQKWITIYAFFSLFTFMMVIRSSSVCLKEVILKIENTITDLQTRNNSNYTGKSATCPVKTKWRPSYSVFYTVFHRKGVLDTPVVRTRAGGKIPRNFTPSFTSDPEQKHLPVSNLA